MLLHTMFRCLLFVAPIATQPQTRFVLPVLLITSFTPAEAKKSSSLSTVVGQIAEMGSSIKGAMKNAVQSLPDPARAMKVVHILSGVSGWMKALINNIEDEMKHTVHEGKATEFANKWLNFWGMDSGATGLFKDVMANYQGRMPFDMINGDLIDALDGLKIFIPSNYKRHKPDTRKLVMKIRVAAKQALPNLRTKKGAVYNLINDIHAIFKPESDDLAMCAMKHLQDVEEFWSLMESMEDEVRKETGMPIKKKQTAKKKGNQEL